MLVSPTYFGATARVGELAEVAHARGVPLVVDESWGAHLYFHPDLPEGALRGGADVVLSSTHKIVGSLTQSAILHLGSGELIDEGMLDRSVTLIESTSPNALLTASLDAARRHAAIDGEELLSETLVTLAADPRAHPRDRRASTSSTSGSPGRTSVAAWDPLRLSVDVRGTGATGHRIAELMRERDDVILELFSENVIVATFGVGARAEPDAERLVEALEHAVDAVERRRPRRAAGTSPSRRPGARSSSRRATPSSAPRRSSPSSEAEGRIAAESLAAYPPGVPERPARRAADGADPRLHRRLDRPRRPGPRRERPVAEDDQGGDGMTADAWGVDSEHGPLRDVLLCPPDNFRWGPTSAISKATLESGRDFDAEAAASQHREMVQVYEAAGVTCPLARSRPGPPVPGVRPRLERDGAERRLRHADGPVLAARRVRTRRSASTRTRTSRSGGWSPPGRSRAGTS